MLGLVISTSTWAHVQLLQLQPNQRPIQISSVTSLPLSSLYIHLRRRRALPFHTSTSLRRPDSEQEEPEAEAGMAAMLVGALRRGSGCHGGSRLLAQSLRRFVSCLPLLSSSHSVHSVQFAPTQPGGWWWRCSATTLDALALEPR